MNCALLTWAAEQDDLLLHLQAVLLRLVKLMDDDGRINMAQADIAPHVRLGERQTRQAIKDLVGLGVLTRMRQGSIGRGRAPDLLVANFDRHVDNGTKPPLSASAVDNGGSGGVSPVSKKRRDKGDIGSTSPVSAGVSDNGDNAAALPVSAISDAEFVDNSPAPCIGTSARAQKLTLNTTSQSELNLQPPVPEVTVVVARASSDTPPPPAWQRVLDEVRSPFLDENKSERLILEGAIVQRWIDAGADERLDVIPTVRRLIAAKRESVPWNYFTKAVREAAARRKAAEARQLPITAQETRNEHAPSAPGNLRVSGGKIGPGSANHLRNREAARLADEQRRMESVAGK